MKQKFTLSIIILVIPLLLKAQLSGTYLIGAGGDYATLHEAVADVNLNGLNGHTILELTDGYDETEYVGIKTYPGNSDYTLTIRPEAGASAATISSSTPININLDSTNNVIIDGRPGGTGETSVLTIEHSNKNNASSIWISNYSKNTIIKYCNIRFDGTRGVSIDYSDSTLVEHCDFATLSTGPVSNGSTMGIMIYKSSNNVLRNNVIHNLHVDEVFNIYGIALENITYLVSRDSIYNNFIALNTESTDSSARIKGIRIYDNEANIKFILHNSVYISGNDVTGEFTTCIDANLYGETYILNNIFINKRSNGSGTENHYAYYFNELGTSPVYSDYNLMYSSGNNGLTGTYLGSSDTTLVQWQISSGMDTNSVSTDVMFEAADTGNLHLAGASLSNTVLYGAVIPGIPDIDGEERWADSTFMGADQPTFVPDTTSEPEPEGIKITKAVNIPEMSISRLGENLLIAYNINKPGYVDISVYNITGQKVKTLVSEIKETGEYNIEWSGYTYAGKKKSGIYLIHLQGPGYSNCQKILY